MDKEKPKGISKSTVDAFGPQEKAALLWDTKIAGFGLRVMPSGVKSYIFQYRIGGRGAPSRRYTIGRHGSLTPDQARKIASDLAAKVAAGIDPLEEDRAALKAKADQKAREAAEARKLEELAFSAYVDHFLAHGLDPSLRERTREGYEIALRKHAVPVLQDMPLPDVTAKDVKRVMDSIPAAQPSVRRIVFSVLRLLFKFAADPERGDIPASPMTDMKTPKPPKHRERVLKDDELRLALRAIDATPAPFGPLYAMLFATGQRREEVAGLKWSELDRKSATWTLPAERAKNDKGHIVPLSRRAIAALDRIAGQEGEARPKWPSKGIVFVSSNDTSVSGYSRAKARLDAKMMELAKADAISAGEEPHDVTLEPWRLHDARRTLATGFQRLGIRFEVTEAALNHKSGASRSGIAPVYQRHEWQDEKREAFALWSAYLDQLLDPVPDDKVVPITSAKGAKV